MVAIASNSTSERALRPLLFGGEHCIEFKPKTGDVLPVRITWSGKVWRAEA